MSRPRLRSALVLGAVLATALPMLASAVPATTAPALGCAPKQVNSWERLPVDTFHGVSGLSSPNTVTSYAVDNVLAQDLAATNGVVVQTSSDNGCAWSDSLALSAGISTAQPFSGLTSKIVSVALLQGKRVAAISDGTRPHVMVSSGGSWTTSDTGLPPTGIPKLLRAGDDGHTVYLTVSPTGGGGGDTTGTTGVLGGLTTGVGGVTAQTGLLYVSKDAGHTWAIATTAVDQISGGTGFSQLVVDPGSADRLYGIVGGHFVFSSDGGASFTTSSASDYTALTAMAPSEVVAFESSGRLSYSNNAGATLRSYKAPSGVTSAAFRTGDAEVLIERRGTLSRMNLFEDTLDAVPAGITPNTGSALGDRSSNATFHLLAGNTVLRYVDPTPPGSITTTTAPGDDSITPPRPGVVVPSVRNVTLPVGQSATEQFTLQLPKNPTPLDLYFLIDVSPSMSDLINNVKKNMSSIVGKLEANRTDLAVGIGTIGTGPGVGEQEWPRFYAYPPIGADKGMVYKKPLLYQRVRKVFKADSHLQDTINSVTLETDPAGVGPKDAREGVLLGLKALSDDQGIHTQMEDQTRSPFYSNIKPGQEAGWRGESDTRRVVILATDEAFDIPYPTPTLPGSTLQNPLPDFSQAIRALKKARTQVIGLSAGREESLADLRHVASATGAVAPAGPPVICDNGAVTGTVESIDPGGPLVCDNGSPSDAIVALLKSLVDQQDLTLVPLHSSPVLHGFKGGLLRKLNVKIANGVPFDVTVSCAGVKAGSYHSDLATVLRGTNVGTAHLNVTCVKAAAVVAPKRIIPPAAQPLNNPPAAPVQVVQPAVPPVAPPAPAVQVQPQAQPQVQGQTQLQPLSAGALQEEQQLQLALALNGAASGTDDTTFNPGQQMAMVDRRKRQEVQAMGVLAFAMTACAGLGLARLRTRPDVQVRRAR